VFVTYPAERSVVSLAGNNSEFPAGTRMIFAQTTAPTGFTKDATNYNNHALRVVTGTAGTGGTVDFVTAFASQTPTGNVSVTANTAPETQGGNISASTGLVAQGGNISASTDLVAQGGNISVSTGNATVPVTVVGATQGGNISVSTGNAAGPVSVGNTTLAIPTIPSHDHNTQVFVNGQPARRIINQFAANLSGAPEAVGTATGGGGAHTHPGSGGNHVHPASGSFTGSPHTHNASGGNHAHPASGTFTGSPHQHTVSASFTGSPHQHPVSASFTGNAHNHTVSAPATFSGSSINLAVKYLDVITATKD
jgi:hypothetical protein